MRLRARLSAALASRQRLVRTAVAAAPGRCALVALLALVSAALPAAGAVAAGRLVQRVASGYDGTRDVLPYAAAVAATFLAQFVAMTAFRQVTGELVEDVDVALQARVLAACLAPTTVAHLDDPRVLDAVNLARQAGPNQITPGKAALGLATRTQAVVQGAFSGVLVARFSPLAAVVIGAAWLFARRRLRADFVRGLRLLLGRAAAVRHADYVRELAFDRGAAKEVRVYGLAGWLREVYATAWAGAVAARDRERRGRRSAAVPVAVLALAYAGCLAALGTAGARGDAGIGLVTTTASAMIAMAVLGTMSEADAFVVYGTESIDAVADVERLVPAARAGERPAAAPRREIAFEGVEFRYPGAPAPVLRDLDLTLRAGEAVAVVGVNGAGKTTLVKLVAGLLEPTAGRITVDGVPLAGADPRSWQRLFSAVFQDFVRYPLPLRENVDPLGTGESSYLDEVAAASALDEVVGALPRGWDTVLARGYEGGVDLSSGQWQRVALARALYGAARGAAVVVLDEPTAHLDAAAEAWVYERFLVSMRGRTSILVSHRMSTVRAADRIVVLDGGRVVEDGTHDDLVARGGRYAELFALQAAAFGTGAGRG